MKKLIKKVILKLGFKPKVLEAINKIRWRAYILPLDSVTFEDIRHERRVKLAFENHRFRVLIKWRGEVSILSTNIIAA